MTTRAADRHASGSASSEPTPARTGRRHRRRWPWVLLSVGVALVALFYVGGGWYFSNVIHNDVFAVHPGIPATTQTGTLDEVSLPANDQGSVTMTLDDKFASPDKYANATVGIQVGDSLLVAGPATTAEGATVTRPILDLVGDVPEPGAPAGINRDVWTSPDQLGLEYSEVAIQSQGVGYPAWVIPGSSTTWAVLVHGKGGYPPEMLRMATTLHARGVNCLLIRYVNDPDVPRSPEGMYGYGTIEVPQVEAAVAYAQAEGAQRTILGGVSHGAAISLAFLETSDLATTVDAVILDSPPADLAGNIDAIGDTRSLPVVGLPIPESLESVAMLMTQWRFGVDLSDYDRTSVADQITAPTLILQGGMDTTVDISTARDLAAAMGSTATLVEQPEAQHVGSWNVDPEAYAEAMTTFLDGAGV
jgi:alpha-beta hydrolase superfamily lysophospholipase